MRCKCGHLHSQHHKGVAYGLEVFACEICGCSEFDEHNPAYDPDDARDQGYHDEGRPYGGGWPPVGER